METTTKEATMEATITHRPVHIDDMDPDTIVFVADGETHIQTCPVITGADLDTRAAAWVGTIEEAAGWLCEQCIDTTPRHALPGVTDNPINRGHGDGTGTGNGRPAAEPATDKQLGFLAALATQTGTDLATLRNEAGGFTAKEASDLIEILMAQVDRDTEAAEAPTVEAMVAAHADRADRKFTPDEMTPELVAFATDWAKDYTGSFEFMVDMRAAAGKRALSAGQAKGTMNCFLAAIRRGEVGTTAEPAPAPAGDPDEGIYRVGEMVVKVQHGRGGGWYCKELTDVIEKILDEDGKIEAYGKLVWEYIGRKVRPTAEQLIPQDEAAKYGQVTGRCMDCGRKLTDENSIELGIGPVCILK